MPALVEDRRAAQEEFDWVVGIHIKALREKHEMTQRTLADLVDVSQASISRFEAGERAITLQQAIAVAEVLNVPLRRLFQPIP